MHFNLKVLNLLHSLCDHSSNTPDIFRASGYEVAVVEPVIELPGGRVCKPECILAAAASGDCICFESKSGTGNSVDQIERYGALTLNRIRGAALTTDPSKLRTLNKVLVCQTEAAQRQVEQLDAAGSDLCVITYDAASGPLKIVRGSLSSTVLNTALHNGLIVPWPPEPSDFISFDCDSTDVEIAVELAPQLRSQALRRRKSFTCFDICKEAIRYWPLLHNAHKQAIETRIEKVLENLLVVGFPGQFEIVARRGNKFDIEVTADALRAAQRDYAHYSRRLLNMEAEALEELQKKLDLERADGQQPLFAGTVLPPPKASKRGKRKPLSN